MIASSGNLQAVPCKEQGCTGSQVITEVPVPVSGTTISRTSWSGTVQGYITCKYYLGER